MSDLSYQVRAPLGLELATGDVVTVTEWSLSSLTFPGESDVMPSKGILSIPFQGVDIRFLVRFKPGADERELVFDGLTGRQRETLAVFYRSILSGRMASTEEVITSLDTPVDLVPMEETEKEKTEGSKGKTPRAMRVVWNLVVYCLIGAVVFGLLGQQIWSRLSTIPVGQSRVVAERIEHRAPTGAYVEAIRVTVGETVTQGQTLVVLSSPGHNGTLTEIRTDLRRAEGTARQTRAALAAHQETRAEARRPFETAVETAIAAQRPLAFFEGQPMPALRRAQQALAQFDAGISQRADDFHARLTYLEARLRADKDDISQLKRALSAEKSIGGAADIVALSDGIVAEIPAFEDQFLSRGDMALTLEDPAPRQIVGWLDESMAAAVYPGMSARMTAISGGQTRQIQGVVSDVVAMPNPDKAGSFGLRVSVLPADWVARDVPELLRADAPMELVLDRNPAWLTNLKELFNVRP